MTDLLLNTQQLSELIAQGKCLPVDCRFDLSRPRQSFQDYQEGHIPGAVYAHLDEHLASEITPQSGRHPLPDKERFAAFLASIGWQENKWLVAYDAGNGMFAARLWWLMRYFGLSASLLDGGLAAWTDAGLELQRGVFKATPGSTPVLIEDQGMVVAASDILAHGDQFALLDARAPERFSGAVEPLDSKAGHIPGALNRPFALNLDASGRFKSAGQLRIEFGELLAQHHSVSTVHYCGSGVTACHNAFAMELAGLQGSKIYPGSWSEWIRDPARPVETSV
ncbi:MAG TPA: sulfurtransferase [Xanthomonadales bacterium]|nr:sulfurtransferase [Xanthomonadales bacterium]